MNSKIFELREWQMSDSASLAENADNIRIWNNVRDFDLSAEFKGMGLRNIRTRVESFNGNLDIDSQPGKGTEIHVEFKL